MIDHLDELESQIQGDVETDEETIDEHSRDTSLFAVRPKVVVFPKNPQDIETVVKFVNSYKSDDSSLSITGRSACTDMTGGPLNESIILSFTRYFKREHIDMDTLTARVEPGVYYRDFEKEMLPDHLTLPAYPASKTLCALGGMVMNNCGGEKTLRYGQMREFVEEVEMTLSDGNTYTFGEITLDELEEKKQQDDLEGRVYRQMHELLENNYELVKNAKPATSKNSSGYALWRVYDKEAGTFNLAQLFVGSQGTLGILNSAKVKLQRNKPHERLVALFMDSWDPLPDVVNVLLPLDPESLETFDEDTEKLGLRFLPEIAKRAGENLFSFALRFLPEAWIGVKMLGIPKLVVLVELAEETEEELDGKTELVEQAIADFDLEYRVLYDEADAEKYWIMRRQSFALLREHVRGKQTVPFVEDFCVQPDKLPEFLPKAIDILEKHGITANIAGHAGNGNYHIIPLMDLTKPGAKEKIVPAAEEFYDLVIEYGGTITAEHNDGIMRTPFIEEMYGEEVYDLFEETKHIFDPDNIFNPGKKVGGTIEYLEQHIEAKEK